MVKMQQLLEFDIKELDTANSVSAYIDTKIIDVRRLPLLLNQSCSQVRQYMKLSSMV